MSDKVKLEAGQWLDGTGSFCDTRAKVLGVCGDAVIVRWERDTQQAWPFDINQWPSILEKPAPPESPDDVVHEFNNRYGEKIQVYRDGTAKIGRERSQWKADSWTLEIVRLAIAARGRV